jgi:Flp pilus assembly protein TadG
MKWFTARRPGRSRQRGAVAVITGLTATALVGFLGISVDLGRLFVIKSELQTGMDACALAAATQLRPGLNDPNALDRAIAYGRTPANRVNFQGQALDRQAIRFAFSETLGGAYVDYSGGGGAGPLANNARYVRCTYPLANVPVFFARVLDASNASATVAATAVATLSPAQTSCGIPLALCRGSGGAPNYGLTPGQWLSSRSDTGCSTTGITGSFCWVDFSPPAGGASELSNLIRGQGQCDLRVESPIGQTGVIASLVGAWNTRFGIYRNNSRSTDLLDAPPDYSGYGYTSTNWPSQQNAYADYRTRRGARTPYSQTVTGVKLAGGASAISSAEHNTYGRDRRLVLAPIVDCAGFAVSQTVPLDAWGCVLLLAPLSSPGGGSFTARLEYLGPASVANSPCVTAGLAGGTAGPLVPVLAQ